MSYPIYPKTYKTELKIADKTIKIEVGKFSEQVSAAVLATCGETVVHTTVALGNKVDWGYFPLQVEYVEKLYAGGIIKGSRWVKREGRPSDDAVLKGRVIDRTIRPLFPEGITNEVQVISTIFSYDGENDPDMVALVSATVALAISEIPFLSPVAGLRVGFNRETQQFIINPTKTEQDTSDLDLIVSGSGNSIVMVEAGANEINETVMIDAMIKAQQVLGEVCEQINGIVKEIGKPKVDLVAAVDESLQKKLDQLKQQSAKKYQSEIKTIVEQQAHLQPTGLAELLAKVGAELEASQADKPAAATEPVVTAKQVAEIFHTLIKEAGRAMIINEKVRPDGRKPDEIRPIWCEVDIFPRTHGSAMFKRGATQACTITTLGSPAKGWYVEDLEGEAVRHYMHHYNMPPYASGEAGRMMSPKRREIGHGCLAERALLPMIPSQEAFPYTIRVVSEIVSSNGSTSQASVCGSTLSLMAAGVPIKKPVAGIAMGLMSDGKNYVVLSDIQGLEDHVGDMDFKVAGTKDGITAMQMDIKLTGLPREILEQALAQAKTGRLFILDKMLACLAEPRAQLSQYAPKIQQLTIPSDRIGELIGPGGKVIKAIIAESGAEVDVDEDEDKGLGVINISSDDQAKIDAAAKMIEDMMRVIEEGEEFDGTVTRVEDYGIFVTLVGNKEGLVHVSEMSVDYVPSATELANVGDKVHVRVNEIKEDGKIGLTMLTLEEKAQQQANKANGQGGGGGGRRPGGDRGGFSDRGGRGGSRFGGSRGGYRDRNSGSGGGSRGGSSDRGGSRGGFGDRRGR